MRIGRLRQDYETYDYYLVPEELVDSFDKFMDRLYSSELAPIEWEKLWSNFQDKFLKYYQGEELRHLRCIME